MTIDDVIRGPRDACEVPRFEELRRLSGDLLEALAAGDRSDDSVLHIAGLLGANWREMDRILEEDGNSAATRNLNGGLVRPGGR